MSNTIEKKVICIVCPVGCEITVEGSCDSKVVNSMAGQQCKRGEKYAENEFINPKRILATTVKIKGYDYPVIPVRSDDLIPKDKLFECMDIIRKTAISTPVKRGDIVIENILNTGVNIVTATDDR
jgi:CxxC motif-containing protein